MTLLLLLLLPIVVAVDAAVRLLILELFVLINIVDKEPNSANDSQLTGNSLELLINDLSKNFELIPPGPPFLL